MTKPSVLLNEVLLDILQDDDGICQYLNIALEENGPEGFLYALKNVIETRDCHMTQLAKDANLNRQNLYKMLSGEQNPRWNNINALVNALGFKLTLLPKETEAS